MLPGVGLLGLALPNGCGASAGFRAGWEECQIQPQKAEWKGTGGSMLARWDTG